MGISNKGRGLKYTVFSVAVLASAVILGIRSIYPDINTMLSPEKIDQFIKNATPLAMKKDGISTTVCIIDGRDAGLAGRVLVKRFNYKGFFHFIWRILIGNRAERLYHTSRRLLQIGLPVSEPFSYISASWRQRRSYYLSSVIEHAVSLANIDSEDRKRLTPILADAIAKWHSACAVHGDMKWTNILLRDDKVFFIDLDSAVLHNIPCIQGIAKDLSRFFRSGLSHSSEDWVEKDFLPSYLDKMPPSIREKLDIDSIKDKALRDWQRKRSKTNRK